MELCREIPYKETRTRKIKLYDTKLYICLYVPKFAGSNPAEAVRAKKSSARLPPEGK